MSKTILIKEDSLQTIKEKVVDNSNIINPNDVCVNEAAPEVDEYTIGGEEDSPVGGRYYHASEENNNIVTESKNSNRAHRQTRQIIAKYMGTDENDPTVAKAEQEFEAKMFDEGKRTDWMIVLEPIAYNWYLESEDINLVKKYVNYIYLKATETTPPSAYIANVKKFGTFNEVKQFLDQQKKADDEASRAEQANMSINLNKNYEVRGPLTYDEANEIGNYSCPNGKICYTQSEDTWESEDYGNYGTNKCYVLLCNGWEDIPAEHDGSESNNGLPTPLNQFNGYDKYGLSMIFVWIGKFGNLSISNTRWNHAAEYAPGHSVDLALTELDIAKLMSAPFEQVFGVKKTDINAFVKKKLNNPEVYLDQIFDDIYEEHDGITAVRIGNKYNYVVKYSYNERYLLWDKPYDEWFDSNDDFFFNIGMGIVYLDGKAFFIDKNGKLHDIIQFIKSQLSNGVRPEEIFDIDEREPGVLRRITFNWRKFNFINLNTKQILWDKPYEEWFEWAKPFEVGIKYTLVRLNQKLYYLDVDGNLHDFLECLREKIKHENLVYVFDDVLDEFNYNDEVIRRVKLYGKYNFVNVKTKELIWDKPFKKWFPNAYGFYNGYAKVTFTGGVWYNLSKDGKLYNKEGKLVEENRISFNNILTENIEPEVESSEVDLSSFKKKDSLVPSIWKDEDTLNSKVRLKLLDIADDFWEFVNITWVEPKGIILTGSICNFNWSKFSDIDLHLIVDFDEIDDRDDFVRDYMDAKKNEWNNEHKSLKIMDYPVELYVQNIDEMPEAGGIYDLEENKWLRKPNKDDIKPIGLNKFSIKDRAATIMTIIDDMWDVLNSTDDMYDIRQLGKDASKLWDKVKKMRKNSLSKNGEGGAGNIVYKVMRRMGYLDKIFDLRSAIYDKLNSVTEATKQYKKLITEEIVADGNAEHNPYEKRWKAERQALKNFLVNCGKIMTSKENGKQYKVYFDQSISDLIGYNYCICVQWNPIEMKPESTIYIRALDKFTNRIFQAQYDDRGKDNMRGTHDDTGYSQRFETKRITKQMITESQESKSIAAAKKLAMQRLGYNEQEADEFVRVKLRNDIPSLRTPQGGKFILGATRMFCDGELRNANDIGNLNSTLKLVASDAHINEYDRNLNGLSCQELVQRFAKAMSDNLEAEKAEINQMVFDTPSDYEIVRIDSFEQAEEYGDYVSWCVTHDEYMFDSYTCNGINQFYFCLKHGFEHVDEQPGKGCPLDEYGLSMIAVSVNENGMLNTCTCRWNHDNGGDDSIMNSKEVSQVIGMNFFEVFKPNNKWKELLADVKQRLANGEDPRDVFDDVGDFIEGFAVVELNGKRNFINQDGRFLSDQWFDYVGDFGEGFVVVELNGKLNFINQEGSFISDQWFDGARDFYNGFAAIRLNEKCNFINQEGRIVSDQWFDYVRDFYNGFAAVKLNEKWNFINQDGRIISDQWFDVVYDFREGFAVVELNDKRNFINQEGIILSDQWFDNVLFFKEGFAAVRVNEKYNFINKEGSFISDQWFDDAHDSKNGFAVVALNGKWNYINQEGRFLSGQWFDDADDFYNGFASVDLNGKRYRLDTNGNLTLRESKKVGKQMITEANNKKRFKRQTLNVLAQGLGLDLNDPQLQSLESDFRNVYFGHLSNQEIDRVIGYEPLFAKCALDLGFPDNDYNDTEFTKYVNYLILNTKDKPNYTEIINHYKSNVSSFDDMRNVVGGEIKASKEANAEQQANMGSSVNPNYQVLGPLTFDEAKRYGNRSGRAAGEDGRICYSQYEDTWLSQNYSNKNKNKCYILLRNDWQDLKGFEHDGSEKNNGLGELSQYNAYDNYGLSMIMLFINPEGELHECNVRWNHGIDGVTKFAPGRGVDHALTEMDIANLMGVPFEQVFNVKKIDIVDNIKKRLANGENPSDIFDYFGGMELGVGVVELDTTHGKKWNYLTEDGNLLWDKPLKEWFDSCSEWDYENEIGLFRIGGKYNFIKSDGTLLWKGEEYPNITNWFDYAQMFEDKETFDTPTQAATVKLGLRWLYIGLDGKLYNYEGELASLTESTVKVKKLITESKNSDRAHRQTRQLMAQWQSEYLGEEVSPDDPEIIEREKEFERGWFGEGKRQDWFIVLEPNIYVWSNDDPSNDVDGYVNYIYQHATSLTKEKTITIEYLESHGVQEKSKLTPEQQQELAALIKPERQKLLNFINPIRKIWDFDELKPLLDKLMEEDRAAAKEAQANMEVNLNPNYDVFGPLSFEESKEYGKFSGLDAGKGGGCICYTTNPAMRVNYSKGEKNSLYLLLRKDWETVNTTHDGSEKNNGLPEPLNVYNGYDSYGLSMIFVWVDPTGNLAYSNTRWNHEAQYAPGHGVDTAMTEVDIANLMGAPFEQVFNVKKLSFEEKIEEIKKAIEKNNTIERCGDIWQFIDEQEELARDFDKDFGYRCLDITIDNRHGILKIYNNKWQELYSKVFVDKIMNFNTRTDFARVENNGQVGYLNNEGIITEAEYIGYLNSDLDRYRTSDIYYLTHGDKPIFEMVDNKSSNGLRIVKVRGDKETNMIDDSNHLVFDRFYDSIFDMGHGLTEVIKETPNPNGGYFIQHCNIINKEGKALFDMPFEELPTGIYEFSCGLAEVEWKKPYENSYGYNTSFNYIDGNGNFLLKENVPNATIFINDVAVIANTYEVQHDLYGTLTKFKYNFINVQGNLKYDEWFVDIDMDCFEEEESKLVACAPDNNRVLFFSKEKGIILPTKEVEEMCYDIVSNMGYADDFNGYQEEINNELFGGIFDYDYPQAWDILNAAIIKWMHENESEYDDDEEDEDW